MEQTQLDKIKQVGDLIAKCIEKSGRDRRLRQLEGAKSYGECRNILRYVIRDRIQQGAPEPLFSIEDYMAYLFPASDNLNLTPWRETRDLLLFRIYEQLHNWLQEQGYVDYDEDNTTDSDDTSQEEGLIMAKHLIGLTLIDAPHSALNNAGTEASQATENIVTVKKLQKGRDTYPYVSGQAWRNWWRTTLEQEFDDWHNSPIEREKKIAFTAADPVTYDDDDVFGYMRAQSEMQGKKKVNVTVTRLSPLKCSPLISIDPQIPTNDFGVMARQEDDPVPYEHQFYSCILQGIFSLDLNAVGTFSDINRTGYKNIASSYVQTIEDAGGTQVSDASEWTLPKEIRVRRCQQTLEALPILSGGAKLTSHLTDVTPKLIILSILDGGNHPFMNLMVERRGRRRVIYRRTSSGD